MAKPFYCALALVALSGCPSPQCPDGSAMVEGRCADVDVANTDAGGDASPVVDALASLDAFSRPDACVLTTWFRDRDGDSYGSTADSVTGCVAPAGYVALDGDCNDASPAARPGVAELCNRMDDDCDGASDEGLTRTIVGEPLVIPTGESLGGQVGILPYSAGHMLLWAETAGMRRVIVSSAVGNDNSTTVAPQILAEGVPAALRAISPDEAVLIYQPFGAAGSRLLLARRISTVLGRAMALGSDLVIENAPECCQAVTTSLTRERVIFTWRTNTSDRTYARSCARDLTDCRPRVTLFTEHAFVTGLAGDGPSPIVFFAATLPGDVGLHAYADRIDARTLAFENRPLRVNAGMAVDFPSAVANNPLAGTVAAIIATDSGTREFVRFASTPVGEDLRILSRTALPVLGQGGNLPFLLTTRSGFELLSDSGSTLVPPSYRVHWESFTSAGAATEPVTWSGPEPTSFAVSEGGFLRSEEGPPRLVFQRTGCE